MMNFMDFTKQQQLDTCQPRSCLFMNTAIQNSLANLSLPYLGLSYLGPYNNLLKFCKNAKNRYIFFLTWERMTERWFGQVP